MYSSWPVEIRPIGLAACGTTVWRFRGQLRVTAVVKATFSLVPGGAMALAEPDGIHVADVHHDGDPAASLWAGSDLAPFRLLADVVAVGHAHVPPGGGAVRLGVFRERTPLVDKTIRVAVDDTAGSGEPAPVPLRYERAFGGKSSSSNPVGTGRSARSPLPNLIDPGDPRRAIGFGPIARSWPSRRRLLGELEPGALEQAFTEVPSKQAITEVPSKFDWAYFQAAPSGQVVEFLRGDEWIVLEGMHREHPALQTYLPGPVGAGRIYGLGDPGGDTRPLPIAFHADNLHIDADRGRCSLAWRASFSVPDEEVLSRLIVLAGVEFAGHPISWPDDARLQCFVAEPAPDDAAFGMATVALPPDESPLMGTIALTDEQAAAPIPMLSPFRLAAPGSRPLEPRGDIPGAPWASTLAPVVARPLMSEETRSLVLRDALVLPDDLLEPEAPTTKMAAKKAPIAADPAPPPIRAPDPGPPEAVKERSWSWATVAEPPRVEPTAPRAPRPIPKPVVKDSLYGRFSPPKK